MNLFDQINQDIKAAMLAKEKVKLESLRAIKAAFLVAKTEKGAGEGLSDDAALKIIQKLVKQREESAEIYTQQGRNDLADIEKAEAEYIKVYLPAQLSEKEIEHELKSIISETGASSMSDMGKVMGIATKKFAGRADGKIVSGIVRKLLGA